MSKIINAEQRLTVGLDLGDRWSYYWIENQTGDMVESGKSKTTREGLSVHFPAGQRGNLREQQTPDFGRGIRAPLAV